MGIVHARTFLIYRGQLLLKSSYEEKHGPPTNQHRRRNCPYQQATRVALTPITGHVPAIRAQSPSNDDFSTT